MEHERYLRRAIALAVDSARSGRGGPFGALIVRGGAVIAEGVNSVTVNHDPTAHAEIAAIREACRKLSTFSLRGCVLYASCEPCPMCLGAIYWARLDAFYYASTREDASAAGFDDSLLYQEVCLAPDRRRIPGFRLLGEEGGAAFAAWLATAGRVPY
jgi:tRNA(Arg) A34 adenosine deaminase TadA